MTVLIPSDAAAVAAGAVIGALSRHHAGRLASECIASDPKRFGHLAGWHTAGINIMGSFALGSIAGTPVVDTAAKSAAKTAASQPAAVNSRNIFGTAGAGITPRMKLLMGVGFCGSFTTFSTYSVDVVTWLQEGKTNKALSYVMTNNVGGFVAAAAGLMIVKKIFG